MGLEWIEVPMKARIFAWTRTWHRFDLTDSLELPFVTVVAELDECGIRLLGRLDDPDRIDPAIGEEILGRPGSTRVGNRALPTLLWSRVT